MRKLLFLCIGLFISIIGCTNNGDYKQNEKSTAVAQAENTNPVNIGIFTFNLPECFNEISQEELQLLKSNMVTGGRNLAENSKTADPSLFDENYLSFFSGYETEGKEVQIFIVGDKFLTNMDIDQMSDLNIKRIEWGKSVGQLSNKSKGVEIIVIDGVPCLLMDIIDPSGIRIQTYTVFIDNLADGNISFSIIYSNNAYNKYEKIINNFIDTLKINVTS